MKKLLSAVVVAGMVMGANAVWADSFTSGTAGNIQGQVQDIGAVDLGANGAVSAVGQEQVGLGISTSDSASGAFEAQIQGENTSVTGSNGSATHSYDTTAVTEGASGTIGGGIGFHAEGQTVYGGIATLGDGNGTASVSGSAMQIDQGVLAGGGGNAAGEAGALADYNSSYTYNNSGATSSISQSGSQSSIMGTGAIGGSNGMGGAALEATQIGGTAAVNDGNGTAMSGAGLATGSIETVNGTTGPAAAGSIGVQSQGHSYSQYSSNGAQSQWSSGYVGTGNTVYDVTP